MDTTEALARLEALAEPREDLTTEVNTRERCAYLRMEHTGAPGDFAVVSTPGDRWFSLDVRGGYSVDRFEEGLSDDEVNQVLEDLVQLATAYLSGARRTVRTRILRLPQIVIEGAHGSTTLRLSLPHALKHLFGSLASTK